MIGRITQGFMKDDFLQNLKNNNEILQRTQRKLNSGMKILLSSDDPANTINYMKWTGKTQDLNKYNEIIGAYKNKLNFVDGHGFGNAESAENTGIDRTGSKWHLYQRRPHCYGR